MIRSSAASLLAVTTALCAAWVASPSLSAPQGAPPPKARYDTLVLVADFSRGNPRIELQDATGESDHVTKWRQLVAKFRLDPAWKTFPGRDLDEQSTDHELAQIIAFDFLGHQGWRLAAVEVTDPLPNRMQSGGLTRRYFFQREL